MKVSRLMAAVVASVLAVFAYADANKAMVVFSTKAPAGDYKGDTYADGSVVVDGEWYALCWSKNAEFGGFTSACGAAAEGDRVLLVAPLANGGHCPMVAFQLDKATLPNGGQYFVFLLDTRGVNGVPSAVGANGLPAVLNGSVATTATASKLGTTTVVADASLAGGGSAGAWSESAVAADVPAPVIKAFRIAGENAIITVSQMHPSVRYNVFSGATLDKIDSATLEVPMSAEKNDVEVVVPASAGKFFSVSRQPLK